MVKRSLLSESSITSQILRDANKRHSLHAKQIYKRYVNQICEGVTNHVLDYLPSVTGLPRSVFLSRLAAVGTYVSTKKEHILSRIENILQMLSDFSGEEGSKRRTMAGVTEKAHGMRTIREIANTPEKLTILSEWMQKHSQEVISALVYCLNLEHEELAEEACFTAAFLARKFRLGMQAGSESLIAGLIRTMAIAMVPKENHIDAYREARERHNDLELIRGKPMPFHFPRQTYDFAEVHHRLIGVVYYTIADILNSIPLPKLYHFYECRIFRRKEMTRTLLFQILYVITLCLPELKEEAKIVDRREVPEGDKGAAAAEELRRAKVAQEWDDLPALLYTEILRAYEDNNLKNKDLILDIMEFCRLNAPVRLPIFEADAITALELYNARTGGLKTDASVTDKPTSTGGGGGGGGGGAAAAAVGGTPAASGAAPAAPKRLSIVVQPNLLKDPSAVPSTEGEPEDDSFSYNSELSTQLELVRKSQVPDRLPSILNFTPTSSTE
ncbi:hypothetical protein SprV_0501751300 [Sparganum proliferum]